MKAQAAKLAARGHQPRGGAPARHRARPPRLADERRPARRAARAVARVLRRVRRADLPDHAYAGLSARPPARPDAAPHRRGRQGLTRTRTSSFWPGVATCPGLPSTAIPLGLADGLPIGAQIVGPWLEDRTTLKLAELIEQAFGGFVAPRLEAGFERRRHDPPARVCAALRSIATPGLHFPGNFLDVSFDRVGRTGVRLSLDPGPWCADAGGRDGPRRARDARRPRARRQRPRAALARRAHRHREPDACSSPARRASGGCGRAASSRASSRAPPGASA